MTRKRPRVFFIAALVLVSFVVSEPAFGQEAYFSLFPVPCSQKAKTRSIALGDVNGDGYLDLICGNDGQGTTLYLNQGGVLQTTPAWSSLLPSKTTSVALGDIDGDGDLDLVCGNIGEKTTLYRNEGGTFQTIPVWFSQQAATTSVVLGDIDNDGDLDLLCGNSNEPSTLYLNDGGTLRTLPDWYSISADTHGAALGDVDGDGDLDVVFANSTRANTGYLNDNGVLRSTPDLGWLFPTGTHTQSVALGDIDGDGDLDLVCGNSGETSKLYLNDGGALQTSPAWTSSQVNQTTSVVLGDVEGDGDLDIICGNSADSTSLYLNVGGTVQSAPVWSSGTTDQTTAVVLGDIDGDSDLDLICGNLFESAKAFTNISEALRSTPAWTAGQANQTTSLALGNVQGDGDLDVVCGNFNQSTTIYANDAGLLQATPVSLEIAATNGVAVGDIDGDGDLDLVCGNGEAPTTLYWNDDGTMQSTPSWSTAQSAPTTSVALGDIDGDGDLDLVCGNSGQPTRLYRNDGGTLQTSYSWESEQAATSAVALGDTDGDGDLDLVCGNQGESSTLYMNDEGIFRPRPSWRSVLASQTMSVALGDIDGDGDLDLVCGNYGERTTLYLNDGGLLRTLPSWSAADLSYTRSVALGDVDRDGDLDLVCGNFGEKTAVYLNDGGALQTSPVWSSPAGSNARAIALGDVEGDGDLDIVCGVNGNSFFFSGKTSPVFKSDPVSPTNQLPNNGAYLRFVAVEKVSAEYNRVRFTARDVESDRIWVVPEYQYKGESDWYPAVMSGYTGKAGPFATSPAGVRDSIDWDTHLLEFGKRDVMLRLRVIEIPRRVSVIQHIAPYVKEVGVIEPYRPAIVTSTNELTFSTVTVGDTTAVSFVVRNAGNLPLEITRFIPPTEETRIDKTTPFTLSPGDRDTCKCFLEPRHTSMGGTLQILSNDPLVPACLIRVITDIRPLDFDSKLLGSAEKIPLGEAVTVEVTPAPQVHLEQGFVHYRPHGSVDGFPGAVPLVPSVNEFIAVIPGGDVTEAGLDYYVSVENSDVVATDPPGACDTCDAYYTQGVQAPTSIASTPRPNSSLGFASGSPIYVDVALAQGTNVVDGFLHYRTGGMSAYESIAPASLDPFTFVLPDTAAGPRGIEYWVEVQTLTTTLTDPSQDPETSPHTIQVTVQNLEESATSPGNAYRMISIPLEMANVGTITLEALLSDQTEFGPYDPYRWRSFRYVPSSAKYVELSDPAAAEQFRPRAGSGFWLISKNANRITTSPVIGYSTATDDAFSLVLPPGWNMVGDPFDFPVAWDSVLVNGQPMTEAENVVVQTPVPWYDYESEARVLEPFQGYWVKNLTSLDVTLAIPAREAASSTRALVSSDRPCAFSEDSWQLTIRAKTSEDAEDAGVAGVSPVARPGRDRLDRSEPPMSPGSSIALYAVCGKELLSRDIRESRAPTADASSSGNVWYLDVAKSFSTSAAGDIVRIEPEGLDRVPQDAAVYLVDRALDRLIDLRAEPSYECVIGVRGAVSDEKDTRFALLIGSEEFVASHRENLRPAPARTVLHQNHPNPFNPTTVIRYETATAGRVQLTIFDVSGARVTVVEDRHREPGRYEVSWNGQNERGEQVSSGVYFYVLETPGTRQTKKMVCVK